MDKISIDVDLKEFSDAMREYLKYSSLDVAEAVNKKAGDVAFSATRAASVSHKKPERKLNKIGKESRLWHALATGKTKLGTSKKGAAVKGKGNADVAEAIWASRLRHIHYSKSLFLHLAKKFGKTVTAVSSKGVQNAVATHAPKRVSDRPEAILEILGVEKTHEPLLEKAIQHGIKAQIKDMQKYINDKIAKRAKAHSGRRR
jgi:phosphoglycolate phosphatase-like HAD superfamily hydrolase